MASFTQLRSGNWRVQVRRKNRYVAETFRRRKDGEEWALDIERNIDRSGSPKPRATLRVRTFGDLIDIHIDDMKEVGRPPRRSKAAVLEALKESLGTVKLTHLNRERLIEFGRKRAKQGAGPATLAIDFAFIRTVVTHATAVHGIEVSAEEVRLARFAMKHLGLVGKSDERDRRPTQDEFDELIEYFESNRRQIIPMGRIVRYAVATTMRQEEICRPDWSDVDMKNRILVIRDRKDPRVKDGNDQKVPLLNLTGYDAWEIMLQQRIVTRGKGRVFPYNHRSVSAAFTRACDELKIEDLHFHDLRHEGTSRLFEAGLPIEKVALVTGHKDWRTLRRYTKLKPEELHKLQTTPQPTLEEFVQSLTRNEPHGAARQLD
ncbi:site-specific integrase [Bradyrhizobium sp. CB3481]|uniref:site-specific integrase n=1 Tax=Bradyrhizobium sp. CB3481 TaxID=3039158 RepID=UPI0024B1FF8A|nr:site-specific integrase [Bradyrhizobium sp. CB3481]WFU14335.1 site-specific integrase [Bradyrhizobium sp. CB3481]